VLVPVIFFPRSTRVLMPMTFRVPHLVVTTAISVGLLRMAVIRYASNGGSLLPRAATPIPCRDSNSLYHPHRQGGEEHEQKLDGLKHRRESYTRFVTLARRQ
jgi:hypothetical protein